MHNAQLILLHGPCPGTIAEPAERTIHSSKVWGRGCVSAMTIVGAKLSESHKSGQRHLGKPTLQKQLFVCRFVKLSQLPDRILFPWKCFFDDGLGRKGLEWIQVGLVELELTLVRFGFSDSFGKGSYNDGG